jgi:muramoyltetrapeptide carboxypeptidase
MPFALPPPLAKGDRVAVVAPASPFPVADVAGGLAWLSERYRVELGEHLYAKDAYLAGTDEERAADLSLAMRDPAVRAIVCARGGYGVLRLVDRLPWSDFAASPKWICGFSDITVLHAAAVDVGVASLHCANLTGLGRGDAAARDEVTAALENPAAGLSWNELQIVHSPAGPPSAEGPLYGGNIALLHALAAANRLLVPAGAILLLEDTTERPYRLDRMLTSLRLGGHLARASAIVLGEFVECPPGADGRTTEDVLVNCTSGLSLPVVRHAPFGHGVVNRPFIVGQMARLHGQTLATLPRA